MVLCTKIIHRNRKVISIWKVWWTLLKVIEYLVVVVIKKVNVEFWRFLNYFDDKKKWNNISNII